MGDSSESIWVIGYGQFGRRAVDQLLIDYRDQAHVTVVDSAFDSTGQKDVTDGVDYVQADGVEWLVDHFHHRDEVRWVIPALPVHLAAQWIKAKLVADGKVVEPLPLPSDVVQLLPNACRLSDAEYAVSHADFICPPDCNEPEAICTHTGNPRPHALHDMLGSLPAATQPNLEMLIMRSHQLAPGVGGLRGDELWGLFARVRELEGAPLLIGTACKCHGIVSSFRFSSRK